MRQQKGDYKTYMYLNQARRKLHPQQKNAGVHCTLTAAHIYCESLYTCNYEYMYATMQIQISAQVLF